MATTTLTADQMAAIEKIALDHLFVKTLETQSSDSLDFHDCSVWGIKAALVAAFEAGRQSAKASAKAKKPAPGTISARSPIELVNKVYAAEGWTWAGERRVDVVKQHYEVQQNRNGSWRAVRRQSREG